MTIRSPQDLAVAARLAGFPEREIPTAVAVALAESGGDEKAIGDRNVPAAGARSLGAWQVNTYYHPSYTAEELLTLGGNARAAHAIWLEGGWRRWTTYRENTHAQYLEVGQAAADDVAAAGDALADRPLGGILPDPLAAVARFLALITSGDTWRRVLLAAGGLTAALVGVALMSKDLSIGAITK